MFDRSWAGKGDQPSVSLGNRFPKHIYHTIVCIGALVAHRESLDYGRRGSDSSFGQA
jgi:hypothetical protein